MTMKTSFWVSVVLIISCQIPYDERLVTATGEKHVGVFEAGCERGHPSHCVSCNCITVYTIGGWYTILSDPQGFRASPIVPPCWVECDRGSAVEPSKDQGLNGIKP